MFKLEVKDLRKCFGDLLVLDNVTFSLREKEFVCLCGPTGCGKTTLLNIIAKFVDATTGLVLLDGEPVNLQSHNIAFVFQGPSLLPWKTLFDNVRFGLEIQKAMQKVETPEAEIDKKVEAVIEMVGLKGFEQYYFHQISAGMQQRVAVARALAVDPDILLMDEPFGNLDDQTRWILHEKLLEVWVKLKKTILFVTHNIEDAVYLADKVIVLSKRPAQVIGTVEIAMTRPRDRFGSDFLRRRMDVMNLLKAKIPGL